MASLRQNTKNYSGSRKGVARFVKNKLTALSADSASIMIITHGLSGVFSVISVIEKPLADIELLMARSFSKLPQPTSEAPTRAM